MSIEIMKKMKERLVDCVQKQLEDISKVDTHELGEAIDMIKDLAEAEYYCTITKSMEDADKKRRRNEKDELLSYDCFSYENVSLL